MPKLVSVIGVLTIAAILIGLVLRYAAITSAYSKVNAMEAKIEESRRRITELEVQLDEAVTLDEARSTALEEGLNYPNAGQIVKVNGAVGGYMSGSSKTADAQPEEPTEP